LILPVLYWATVTRRREHRTVRMRSAAKHYTWISDAAIVRSSFALRTATRQTIRVCHRQPESRRWRLHRLRDPPGVQVHFLPARVLRLMQLKPPSLAQLLSSRRDPNPRLLLNRRQLHLPPQHSPRNRPRHPPTSRTHFPRPIGADLPPLHLLHLRNPPLLLPPPTLPFLSLLLLYLFHLNMRRLMILRKNPNRTTTTRSRRRLSSPPLDLPGVPKRKWRVGDVVRGSVHARV